MAFPKIAEQAIEDLVNPVIFTRGKNYWRQGRVLECEFHQGVVRGKVQGSRTKPYHVKIFCTPERLHPECNCPFDWGGFCKHTVALWLAYQDNADDFVATKWNLILEISSDLFGISSKGVKIKIKLVNGREKKDIDGQALAHLESEVLNQINDLHPCQRRCLQLIHSCNRDNFASKLYLEPSQFSTLLGIVDERYVRIYDVTKKAFFSIKHQSKAGLRLELSLTRKDKLRAKLFLLNPDNPTEILTGTILEGQPFWILDDLRSRFLPFPKNIGGEFLWHTFSYNSEVVF